jgi:hypothetical protein
MERGFEVMFSCLNEMEVSAFQQNSKIWNFRSSKQGMAQASENPLARICEL